MSFTQSKQSAPVAVVPSMGAPQLQQRILSGSEEGSCWCFARGTYVAPDVACCGAWMGTGASSISIDILTIYLDIVFW